MKKILFLSALIALAACSGGSEESNAGDGKAKADEMAARITTIEDSLFENMAFDRRNAQMLLDVYKAYAKAYPLDSRSPEYLFRAAGVARSMKDPQQSVRLYDRIIADYPSWERLPDTYYMKAFTIDSEIGHKGDAKDAYEQVIKLYPEHQFAQDARVMIDNLQYTDEELIQRFQRMQAEQEAAQAQ